MALDLGLGFSFMGGDVLRNFALQSQRMTGGASLGHANPFRAVQLACGGDTGQRRMIAINSIAICARIHWAGSQEGLQNRD
jgi:hypothetical protein